MHLKRYDDFFNEEINLKKTLVGAAIGGSVLLNSPAFTQTNTKKEKDSVLVGRVDSPIVVDKIKIGQIKTDSIKLYYLDEFNNWQLYESYRDERFPRTIKLPKNSQGGIEYQEGILDFIKTEEIKVYNKFLISMSGSFNGYYHKFSPLSYQLILDRKDFDSILNIELNKTFKFNITQFEYSNNEFELDRNLKDYLDSIQLVGSEKDYSIKDRILYIKIGYLDGRKMVRFNIINPFYENLFDFDKLYYEIPYNEFIKIFKK